MVSLSRPQPVPAHDDALARDARAVDTIPAPPPSEPREPREPREDEAPRSRIDSSHRADTLPAPPPDAACDDDEAAPSTERTLPPAS